MSKKFNALFANKTWTLVPLNKSQIIVENNWVFRIKRRFDGSVERLKSRLVAKEFHQRPKIYFKDTFSPDVKSSTIQTILSLDVSNGWKMNQVHVNNTFLQGYLTEEVFMVQQSGFVDQDKKNHVCKLQRAIYGLKQAPCVWYNELSVVLLNFGFTSTVADSSLFCL